MPFVKGQADFYHGLLGLVLAVALVLERPGYSCCAEEQKVARKDSPDAVLEAVKRADAAFQGPFSAVLEIVIPHRPVGPDYGVHTKLCKVTCVSGVVALSVESEYGGNPVYRPEGTPGYEPVDFDKQGNLIVWRSLRKSCLSTQDFHEVHDELQKFRITPQGSIDEEPCHLHVYRYPLGSRDGVYEFDQFVLATGRGFSKHLRSLKSQGLLQDKLLELVFRGNFGPNLCGDWRMLVAPESGYLVREAAFSVEHADQPVVYVKNTGLIEKDGISLPTEGVLTFARRKDSEHRLEITVRDFCTRADGQHLDGLRARLAAPLPDDAEIIDFTGSAPMIYSVGEGPPNK